MAILPDVCLPLNFSEHISRGSSSARIYGVGNLELCRKKVLPLLQTAVCKNVTSTPATHCVTNDFPRPSVGFVNSKFYAFSEFYYTMEDILRMGGKYNSVRFQIAAQVCLYCAMLLSNEVKVLRYNTQVTVCFRSLHRCVCIVPCC